MNKARTAEVMNFILRALVGDWMRYLKESWGLQSILILGFSNEEFDRL